MTVLWNYLFGHNAGIKQVKSSLRKLCKCTVVEKLLPMSHSYHSASSSDKDASEDEFLMSDDLGSDESFKVGLRRSGRRKKLEVKPVVRSKRLRRKRIQEDYESMFLFDFLLQFLGACLPNLHISGFCFLFFILVIKILFRTIDIFVVCLC